MSGLWDELARAHGGLIDPPGSLPDRVHGRLREKVAAWARGLPAGSRVLDVGCGCGLLARRMAEVRPDLEVIGMDLSPEMLRAAAAACPGNANPHWLLGDARRWPLPDQSVDAVVAMDLLVTLAPGEDLELFFAEARRVCRGWLLLDLKTPWILRLLLGTRDLGDRLLPVRWREHLWGLRTLTDRIPVHVHEPARLLPPGPHPCLGPWPWLPAPSKVYLLRMGQREGA